MKTITNKAAVLKREWPGEWILWGRSLSKGGGGRRGQEMVVVERWDEKPGFWEVEKLLKMRNQKQIL